MLAAQVYYGETDDDNGGSFTVTLEDFGASGRSARVCSVSERTRARDIANAVRNEVGSHTAPRLFLDGYELPSDALVCKVARPGSVVLLVPQLTELVSYFVVKMTRPLSPNKPPPQLLVDSSTTVGEMKVCCLAPAAAPIGRSCAGA